MDSRSASLRARKRAARRKSKHLQLLRARLKESHAHESSTQASDSKSFCQLLRTSVELNFKQKRFCILRLPLVMARRRAMYGKLLCLSPLLALKSGNLRGFPGGTPGRLFFRHFFATRQRNGIFAFTERAQLCEAVGEVVESLAEPSSTL